MASSIGYSFAVLFCILSASFLVFGVTDGSAGSCADLNINMTMKNILGSCNLCVTSKDLNNITCTFYEFKNADGAGILCQAHSSAPSEVTTNETECEAKYGKNGTTPAPEPGPTTAPTSAPTKLTTTTTKPTETTPSTPTTVTPAANTTTTVSPSPTPTPTPVTNGTTVAPGPDTNGTTSAPSPSPVGPTPAPSGGGGGFSFATFLGGIVFTLAISSLAYVAFRLYRARTGRNYSNF